MKMNDGYVNWVERWFFVGVPGDTPEEVLENLMMGDYVDILDSEPLHLYEENPELEITTTAEVDK